MSVETLMTTGGLWVLDILLVIAKYVMIGDYDRNLYSALSLNMYILKKICHFPLLKKATNIVMQKLSTLSECWTS
jgi:hypothetical protein